MVAAWLQASLAFVKPVLQRGECFLIPPTSDLHFLNRPENAQYTKEQSDGTTQDFRDSSDTFSSRVT